MNKKIFASIAIVSSIMFSSSAFADSNEQILIEGINQQLVQELTKDELVASSQDYMLEKTVRPQARRSALFAHILDTMAKNATLAKAESISQSVES